MRFFISCLALSISVFNSPVYAAPMKGVENPAYTQTLYLMHCQGCHLPKGQGAAGRVPNMQGYLGNFLKVSGGREFLIQVPGSANAPVDNQDLAQLLNWMLAKFSPTLLDSDWQAFTANEINKHRAGVLKEVIEHRITLVNKIKRL